MAADRDGSFTGAALARLVYSRTFEPEEEPEPGTHSASTRKKIKRTL